MRTERQRRGNRVPAGGGRLTVSGELDVASGPLLLRHVRRLLQWGAGTVTLDLGRLEFVDASGVSSLLAAKRLVEAGGGVLVVSPPPPGVHRVLWLCGVCDVLGLPLGLRAEAAPRSH